MQTVNILEDSTGENTGHLENDGDFLIQHKAMTHEKMTNWTPLTLKTCACKRCTKNSQN